MSTKQDEQMFLEQALVSDLEESPLSTVNSPPKDLRYPEKSDIQGCRSTELKIRACDECRKRKTACYILENSTSCFRCKMEDVECTFTPNSTKKQPQKPLGQPKRNSGALLDDYSNLPGKSLLKKSLSLQHARSSFTVSETTLYDKSVLANVPLDKNNQAQLGTNLQLRRVSPDTLFIVRTDTGVPQWIHQSDEIEQTASPFGWALVNCYFQHCQPVNPILHEKVFLEKYQRNYREITPPLLGAIYCLGAKWWYHSNDLCTTPRPGHLSGKLYDLAVSSFFAASGRPNLSLIQAGLLLLQCQRADQQMAISSVITNLAYRLSLNTNCLAWKLPKWERFLRVRLSWAVFAQNKWIALQESIPSQISEANWELMPLTDDLFEHDGMQPPLLQLYMSHARLSTIISDIQALISGPQTSTIEDLLNRVKPIQITLRKFHQELPDIELSFSLHLSYISAEITLHRFIITRAHDPNIACEPQLVEICKSAAESRLTAGIDLVLGMNSQQVQSLYTFNAADNLALVGVFAALMRTTASPDRAAVHDLNLKKYLHQLKHFSEYEVMSSAIRLLTSAVPSVTTANS